MDTREREALTHDYGREIFARLATDRPLLFTPGWFDERLMEMSMGDEAMKVQLFRFVDVLPMLQTPSSITRHLREYFAEADGHVPRWLQAGARRPASSRGVGPLLAGTAP